MGRNATINMTAKQKVLEIEPDAMCWSYRDELDNGSIKISYWISIGNDGNKCLSKSKNRESWAWAEAYRNLTPTT